MRICNAIGVRFYELPITPEKILAVLKNQRTAEPVAADRSSSQSDRQASAATSEAPVAAEPAKRQPSGPARTDA